MEASEAFWKQAWSEIEQTTDSSLAAIRSTMAAQLTRQPPNHSLFCLVYSAHVLLSQQPELIHYLNSDSAEKSTKSTTPFSHSLAPLVTIELACNSETGCLPIQTSESFTKSQSPFFPLLVQSSLELLQKTVQQNNNEQATSLMLDFVEQSVLPHMLGPTDYQKLQTAMESGSIPEEVSKMVEKSVKHWTGLYAGSNTYISPVLWFSRVFDDPTHIQDAQKQIADSKHKTLELEPKDLLLNGSIIPGIKTPFARPLPTPAFPMYDYEDEEPSDEPVHLDHLNAELIWCIPSCQRLLLLPDDEEDDDKEAERFHTTLELMKQHAFVKPLAPNERRQVMEILSVENNTSDSTTTTDQLIQQSGLTPQNLPRLVEHNPLVAHECLLRLLTTSAGGDDELKNEYLSSLVGMDVSLNSMEVVNRLATYHIVGVNNTTSGNNKKKESTPILHPEYILLFISSCIESCSNIPDRHAQNRLVRLVCVFIAALLRNHLLDVDEIFFQVQSFCVEHSRIREASALFQSLKQQQQGG